MGNIKCNQLIFMTNTEETLTRLCGLTKNMLCQMGLRVNQQKSWSNVGNSGVFEEMVDDHRGYKYLGILENSRNVVKDVNKVIVTNKANERTRMHCKTKLKAANLIRGINEFALLTLNYYIGPMPFKPKKYETINKEVRKILSEYKATTNAARMDRLYLKHDQPEEDSVTLRRKMS
ncbi:uncharacterized protein LOC120850730 [Ixodes scapularis]|uniref:uncharacterized protein LOC120850730 n=1 Tax=Ixodes scapularis TaxID=6945 RepID=UPI001A9EC266|nr:uncharacterized protein LOC120850730 [Ixodes scapularis]